MSEQKTLREADNTVEVEGYLKDVKLRFYPDATRPEAINGEVIIATSPTNEHSISVWERATIKSENMPERRNAAYDYLAQMKNATNTVAALLASGLNANDAYAQAAKIRTSGKRTRLSRNEFPDRRTNEFISRPRISGQYFRDVPSDNFHPHATFSTECYIAKTTRDIRDENLLRVETYIPTYGERVIPFEFTARDDIADYIEDNYEKGCSTRIWGDIINTVTEKKVEHAGFGQSRVEMQRTVSREYQITGGETEPYDEESSKAFPTKLIKKAIDQRENEYIPNAIAKAKTTPTTPRGGQVPGFGAPAPVAAPVRTVPLVSDAPLSDEVISRPRSTPVPDFEF